MDLSILIPILAITLIFGPKLFSEIKDYLLKKEQIKAETELKAEALRLKNSLELEKFINTGNMSASTNSSANNGAQQSNDNVDESSDNLNQKRNSKYENY